MLTGAITGGEDLGAPIVPLVEGAYVGAIVGNALNGRPRQLQC